MRWWLLVVCACAATPAEGPVTRARTQPAQMCPGGGEIIETGLVPDKGGTLSDDEVTAKTTLCAPEHAIACPAGKALDGPVTIASVDDEDKLADVACIRGDLLILNDDAFDVWGLDGITVTGSAVLAGSPNLTTLDGFTHLRVGVEMLVQGNDGLAQVAGAPPAPSLALIANDHLPDLGGFDARAVEDLEISYNRELASLTGLESLGTARRLTIRGNAVTELRLPALMFVDRLEIADEPASTIDLPALSAASDLVITDDRSLAALSLPSLGSVAGYVQVHDNHALGALSLPALSKLGGLEVEASPSLSSLAVNVSSIGGWVRLREVGLTGLDGLASLATIGADLSIQSCANLTSVDGLASLHDVGGDLTLRPNPKLKAKDVEAFVKRIHVGGEARY